MSDERGYIDLPLMVGEEVDASFGERRGLDAEAVGDHNAIVLTNRRLLRLSRSGARQDASFASLRDVHLAEVRRTSRGIRSIWRATLLLAGAGAALVTISYLPIAAPLAAALLLGAAYHLFHHVTVSQEGIILFHAGQEQIGIAYRGNLADQAYAFVNRLFLMKGALSLAPEESGEEPAGLGAPGWDFRHELEDAEMGVASGRGDDTPEEAGGEDVSQTEPHGEPTLMEEAATQEKPSYAEAAPTMEPHGEPTPTEEADAQEELPYAETAPTMKPHGEPTPAEEAVAQEESPYAEAAPTMEPHVEPTPAEEAATQEEPPYAEAAPTMEPHVEPTPAEEAATQEEPPYAEAPPSLEPHGEPTPAEEPAAQEESPYAETAPTMEPHEEAAPQEESEANQPR